MTKKWIAINLLLLGIAGLLEWQLLVSIRQFDNKNDPSRVQPGQNMKQQILAEKLLPQPVPVKNYQTADFSVIPDKNIFSDSRTREEKAEPVASPELPPLTQKPILVGVIIVDNQPRASIIDPTSAVQERIRRAQIKRIGDVYQGYTITDIASDHIVLESGTRREIIPLHEGTKRGPQGKTAILATRVVPFGAGGASGGTAVAAVVTGSGSPARTASAPALAPTTVPAAVLAPAGQARQPVSGTSQTSVTQPAAAQPAAQPGASQVPGNRVIRTPFGDIVRPNRN